MGGVHVVHRGGDADTEDPHEVHGIGGVAGLVENSVLSQRRRADAERPEDHVDDVTGHWWLGNHVCRLFADQQVWVRRSWPATMSPSQPGQRELEGELVEIDDVTSAAAADDQRAARPIEVGQPQFGDLALAERGSR